MHIFVVHIYYILHTADTELRVPLGFRSREKKKETRQLRDKIVSRVPPWLIGNMGKLGSRKASVSPKIDSAFLEPATKSEAAGYSAGRGGCWR